MFNVGKDNESQRRGPAKMLMELRRKYPGRLDMPSETEIRSVISSLMAKQKKGQSTDVIVSNRGIAEPYFETVLQIFRENVEIKAWQIFQEKHPPPTLQEPQPTYPLEKSVKSKISALKASYTKTGQLP